MNQFKSPPPYNQFINIDITLDGKPYRGVLKYTTYFDNRKPDVSIELNSEKENE